MDLFEVDFGASAPAFQRFDFFFENEDIIAGLGVGDGHEERPIRKT